MKTLLRVFGVYHITVWLTMAAIAVVVVIVGWIARLEPDTTSLIGALVLLIAVGLIWRTRRPKGGRS